LATAANANDCEASPPPDAAAAADADATPPHALHELHAADAADGAAGNLGNLPCPVAHLGRLPNDVMEFPPDPVQALE